NVQALIGMSPSARTTSSKTARATFGMEFPQYRLLIRVPTPPIAFSASDRQRSDRPRRHRYATMALRNVHPDRTDVPECVVAKVYSGPRWNSLRSPAPPL